MKRTPGGATERTRKLYKPVTRDVHEKTGPEEKKNKKTYAPGLQKQKKIKYKETNKERNEEEETARHENLTAVSIGMPSVRR